MPRPCHTLPELQGHAMLRENKPSLCLHAAQHHLRMHALPYASRNVAVWVQSILDLRVMTRDCKKEARHFDNGLQEFAYDAAQVGGWASSPAQRLLCCIASFVQHSSQRGV